MSARGMKKIESLCDASFVNLLEDLYDASEDQGWTCWR
jgi:hypothetical protein